MITHLEPDILECKVKCALGSITMNKASGGDGIPAELFQILKDDAVTVLHSIMSANLENAAVATGLENVSFHSNPKERQCQRILKLPHNCTHLTHRGTRGQIATSVGSSKKQESSRKTSISTLLTSKDFDCVDHNTVENSERDRNTRPFYLPPEKSVCRSRSNN